MMPIPILIIVNTYVPVSTFCCPSLLSLYGPLQTARSPDIMYSVYSIHNMNPVADVNSLENCAIAANRCYNTFMVSYGGFEN